MKFKVIVIFESEGLLLNTPPLVFADFCKHIKHLHNEDFASFKKDVLKEYRQCPTFYKDISVAIDLNEYRNERVVLISFRSTRGNTLLIHNRNIQSSSSFGKKYYRMWRKWNNSLNQLYMGGVPPGSKKWMEKLVSLREDYSKRLEGELESLLQVLHSGTEKEKEAAAFMLTYLNVSSREFSQLQKMLLREENGEVQNAMARSIAEIATRNALRRISWKVISTMLRHPLFRCKDKGLAMIEIEMKHRHTFPPNTIRNTLGLIRAYPARLLQEHIQEFDRLMVLYSHVTK